MGILFLTPIAYTLGIVKYNQFYKLFTVLSPINVRAPSFSKWPPILGWMGRVGPLCSNPRLNTGSITLHVYGSISQRLFYYKINVCFAFPVIYTIKTIDVTDGSCEITRCSDVTSRKPCNITSCCVLCNDMSHRPCNM